MSRTMGICHAQELHLTAAAAAAAAVVVVVGVVVDVVVAPVLTWLVEWP